MSLSANYPTTPPSFFFDVVNAKKADDRLLYFGGENGTFFNSLGVLTRATRNEPRINYNPTTLACEGLMLEEQSTNSIRNSEATGATVGVVGSGGAIPTNWGTTSPAGAPGLTYEVVSIGTLNGFSYVDIKMSGTNSSGASYFPIVQFETNTAITANPTDIWSGSVYVALVGGSTAGLTALGLDIVENTSAGGYVANGPTTQFLSTITPSLTRITMTRTNSGNVSTARVALRVVSTVPDATSFDLTLRISAPQLELKNNVTTYIPTTSGALTRGTSFANLTPISQFYNQTEGTFAVEYSVFSRSNVNYARLLTIGNLSDQNSNWYIRNDINGTSTWVGHITSGTTDFESTISSPVGGPYKIASAIALNNARNAFNGNLVGSDDTSVGTPSNKNLLNFSGNPPSWAPGPPTGWEPGAGFHLRKFAYWPKRLPNTAIRNITL